MEQFTRALTVPSFRRSCNKGGLTLVDVFLNPIRHVGRRMDVQSKGRGKFRPVEGAFSPEINAYRIDGKRHRFGFRNFCLRPGLIHKNNISVGSSFYCSVLRKMVLRLPLLTNHDLHFRVLGIIRTRLIQFCYLDSGIRMLFHIIGVELRHKEALIGKIFLC